jgi:sugar/nucleoside kinase (ribokinase family)
MSLLVTGSIGIDHVETPWGQAKDVLGGSAVYFSFAACLFTPVRLVGVVGEDFPDHFREVFAGLPIDLAGLEVRAGSRTFRWHGRYHEDVNVRDTIKTELNVLAERGPSIPKVFRDSHYVFLANTHPTLQRELLGQLRGPKLVVCDTMDWWIDTQRDELLKTLSVVNGVVLNDAEASLLTGQTTSLVQAGRTILELGPKFVVIKKGAHGAMLVTAEDVFVIPAFASAQVVDPTGAGDAFAGGMMGYLATQPLFSPRELRTALACGTVIASLAIESFSLDSLRAVDRERLSERMEQFRRMMDFEEPC